MIIELTQQLDEKLQKKLVRQSEYNPSKKVKDRIQQIVKDYQVAYQIRQKPYTEFNNMSLIERMNLDQQSFNQYVEAQSMDPDEAWRSTAFRPIVRNKIITIAAHVTAAIMYPKVYAQNENDDEDRASAEVMRDLMEWAGEQSRYDRTFVYAVIGALVNPATIIHTEFAEKMRDIKEMKEDGSWTIKEVLDEVFSGFINSVVPVDELYIANPYEHDIQKQPFLLWRRVIDYSTARTKYGHMDNFKYVKPGVQFLYSDARDTFYEEWDQDLNQRLVEEIIYYNRSGDLQLALLNGAIMEDDPDSPNPRKDKMYPFSKSGYELIDDGKFFYYKSLAFKLAPDEQVLNTAYRMVADGTFLQVMPPAVVYGNEEINSSVIVPGRVTTIDNTENPNASFQTLSTNNNLTAGYNLLEKVEGSINESSADILQSGQAGGGDQTAFEISRLEQNARVMLGLFAKMIGFLVEDFGKLRMNDILQFLTIGDVEQIESPNGLLKFRTFLLPDRMVDGKNKTKKIKFDMDMPDDFTTEEDEMEMSKKIYLEEKSLGDKTKIYRVNPTLFRNLKFRCVVKPEALYPKSDALTKALNLEAYGLAIANPMANAEAVTRDLLFGSFDKTKDDPDKYMAQPQAGMDSMGGLGALANQSEGGKMGGAPNQMMTKATEQGAAVDLMAQQ